MAGKASNSINRPSSHASDSNLNRGPSGTEQSNANPEPTALSNSEAMPTQSTFSNEEPQIGSINTTMTHEEGEPHNDMQRMIEKELNEIKDAETSKGLPKRVSYGSTCESTPLRPKSVQSTSLTDGGEVMVVGPGERTNDCANTSGIVINITSGDSNPSSQNGSIVRPLPRGLDFSRLRPGDDTRSKDGDSICTAHSEYNQYKYNTNPPCWWKHPKVRENWRAFLAAFGLTIIGLALIILGIVVVILPEIGFQSYVFFFAGIICFIPGAYHVVYVFCAVQGRKGYDFYQLPLFQ